MEQQLTPAQIYEIARSFMPARIILTANELRVFPALRDTPQSTEALAPQLGCDPRGLDRLLNALVTLGLLQKSASKYSLTDVARRAMLPESDEYLAGLDHAGQMWDTWSTLTAAVRKGGAVAGLPMPHRDREYFEKFISAMHANAGPKAPEIVRLLGIDAPRKIIDVGGGSGAYAAAFAALFPEAEVVLFDLPQVIEIAPQFLVRYAGGERVRLVAGDMLKDEFPGPADLIWLSAIVHMFSPQENCELIARAARALERDGYLAIQDFVMDEERLHPPAGTIFALNMLVARELGDTYTESEIRSWMNEAGFGDIRRVDTPYANSIMIGRKL